MPLVLAVIHLGREILRKATRLPLLAWNQAPGGASGGEREGLDRSSKTDSWPSGERAH